MFFQRTRPLMQGKDLFLGVCDFLASARIRFINQTLRLSPISTPKKTYSSSWWNHPVEKYLVKNGAFSQVGVKIKHVLNHHFPTNHTHIFQQFPLKLPLNPPRFRSLTRKVMSSSISVRHTNLLQIKPNFPPSFTSNCRILS